MAYTWAKVYIEVLDDHKMGTLPDSLWRRVIELILLAKKIDKDGWLPGMIEMSWTLRISPEALESDLQKLAQVEIVKLVDGNWFLTNFAKRQDAETNTERVQEFRKRHRNENGTNRSIDKTRLDTDKDTDSDKTPGAEAPATSTKGNKRKPKRPNLPRERDALFDAIAEVCQVDPATAGASIGNVKAALLQAKPPYSADEVKAFGTWHNSDEFRRKKGPPSLWQLKEKIGIVRNGSQAQPQLATHATSADVEAEFKRLNPKAQAQA